ncbi:DUF1501 domain-containing protein [Sphingomonas sp. BGYR3]|uniref:DUF1501 domain-containing protein n=1 Tax=Sphingomonas sp. BGYR3 TaxID=2975483 RepID=UPI0021A6EF64|nr:DUF1501 domain-containing protein [Sphingomonas sp. BGYR3]MDG5487289.1 DUF1501 domain-containing protein [Sphingomonas sp. BGYR3]
MAHIITTPVSRRTLLARASQLTAIGAGAPLAMSLGHMAEAAAPGADDYRALVCIFLYGGNDHGNTLIPVDPVNHSRYLKIRGAIGYGRKDLEATTLKPRVAQTLTDDIAYAVPPQMPRVKLLFDAGKIAPVLNVGPLITPLTRAQFDGNDRANFPLPPKLFSHNDQQSVWQALGSEGAVVGWGGRLGDWAMERNQHSLLTCISASGNAVFVSGDKALQYQISPKGAIKVQPIQKSAYGSPAIAAALNTLMTAHRDHAMENELAMLARRSMRMEGIVNSALDKVDLKTGFDLAPGENKLADQLRIVARLIGARGELGSRRQVFFVSLDGFDHHNDLSAKHADLMAKLDEGMAAFYMALVELGVQQQVTTFTASDFGRTLVNNGDGSDHGWGSHHFVMGGAVKGGRYYGTAPHISIETDDQVGQGRLLPSTATDQYAATLARWFGVPDAELGAILPNLGNFASRNLGFV